MPYSDYNVVSAELAGALQSHDLTLLLDSADIEAASRPSCSSETPMVLLPSDGGTHSPWCSTHVILWHRLIVDGVLIIAITAYHCYHPPNQKIGKRPP